MKTLGLDNIGWWTDISSIILSWNVFHFFRHKYSEQFFSRKRICRWTDSSKPEEFEIKFESYHSEIRQKFCILETNIVLYKRKQFRLSRVWQNQGIIVIKNHDKITLPSVIVFLLDLDKYIYVCGCKSQNASFSDYHVFWKNNKTKSSLTRLTGNYWRLKIAQWARQEGFLVLLFPVDHLHRASNSRANQKDKHHSLFSSAKPSVNFC